MTNKQIDMYVLMKWYWIWKYWDVELSYKVNIKRLIKDILELKQYMFGCAWCENYHNQDINKILICKLCPLSKINNICDDRTSTYIKWLDNSIPRTAKAMLNKCIEAIRKVRRYVGKEEMIKNIMKGD